MLIDLLFGFLENLYNALVGAGGYLSSEIGGVLTDSVPDQGFGEPTAEPAPAE